MTDLTELHRALRKRKRPTPVRPREAPPVFVPEAFQGELYRLPKAALMDIVWDLSVRCAGTEHPDTVMGELRATIDIIRDYRKPVPRAA